MLYKNRLSESDPKKHLLISGNETIARAAIEEGVSLIANYGGTTKRLFFVDMNENNIDRTKINEELLRYQEIARPD